MKEYVRRGEAKMKEMGELRIHSIDGIHYHSSATDLSYLICTFGIEFIK